MFKEYAPKGGWHAFYQRKQDRTRRVETIKAQLKAVGLVLVLLAAFVAVGTLETM